MRPFESKSSFFTAPLFIARRAATAFAFALLVTGVTKNALAAVIDVAPGAVTGSTDGCSLVDAIHAANTNAAAGACAAGDDAHDGGDIIRLAAGVYTLTTADNYWYGPNGLPAIDSKISIFGDPDGSIIQRNAGASPFRLF